MFYTTKTALANGRIVKYHISRKGEVLNYGEVLNLWQFNHDFRNYFCTLLAESEFDAFRWETPSITDTTLLKPFEFVLLDAPTFVTRSPDRNAFSEQFVLRSDKHDIIMFDNLGKDAKLIVPKPQCDDVAYGHIAAFIRNAPEIQVDALWQEIGKTVINLINSSPLWLNTAGDGIAWLHVRIDNYPKYYGYSPYRTMA